MRRRRSLASVIALALGLTACSPSPAPDASPAPGDGPVVAFYGDSYTLGTGASEETKRWSTVISASRGWREFNPSVNGLGFVNQRRSFGEDDLPALIIAEDPDIVVITMGLNDNFSYAHRADRIREAIVEDFTRLHDALPDARFVAVEPFWYTADRPESVDIISGWVEDAASTIDADWIAGASHWLDGHYAGSEDSWMAADGLHPSDEGYAQMAERMDTALKELDPPL